MAPLLGPRGAAHRFAPQKGADEAGIALLERGLGNLADVVERTLDLDVREVAGGGAGGGSGAGLAAFLGARLDRGFDLIASRIDLDGALASADLVITGEGSFDEQTLEGKAPMGVLEAARRHAIPCALVAGRIATDPTAVGFAASAELDAGLEAAVRSLLTDP
jgi:glycerate kinase